MSFSRFVGLAAFAWMVSADDGVKNSPILHAGGVQQQFEKLYVNMPSERVRRALVTGMRRAASEEAVDLKDWCLCKHCAYNVAQLCTSVSSITFALRAGVFARQVRLSI